VRSSFSEIANVTDLRSAPIIRVVIVDDHALVREGVRMALTTDGFEVVADACDSASAVEAVRAHEPDVVVMDISLPGATGIETTELIRRDFPHSRVLMLSVYDHPEYILESVRAGASGYLRKDASPAELRVAVRAVAEGRTAFAAWQGASTEAMTPVLAAAVGRLHLLTPRERDVLIGIASGSSSKEIAAALGLGVRTVESYRETLASKLGISGTAGLTRLAIESKLLID
jgi:two-component system nitrate/nitrite response regulator NarL